MPVLLFDGPGGGGGAAICVFAGLPLIVGVAALIGAVRIFKRPNVDFDDTSEPSASEQPTGFELPPASLGTRQELERRKAANVRMAWNLLAMLLLLVALGIGACYGVMFFGGLGVF